MCFRQFPTDGDGGVVRRGGRRPHSHPVYLAEHPSEVVANMMAALAPAKAISAESPPSLPLLDRKN
jgi:hypothetical protein